VAILLAGAAATAGAQGASYPSFKGGGDLRVRQEIFDDIPVKGRSGVAQVSRFGDNSYLRVRPRLWGEVGFSESLLVRGRLANEFRVYWNPDDDTAAKDAYVNQWDALDEVVVDNLYLDWKGLVGGALDARVGRQDMFYGNGRLIADGTPKDGSRTFYFDALKLTYKGFPENTIDFLAIYNQPENQLAIDRRNRDLTGYTNVYNDMTESGAGLYWKSSASKTLPFEAYYLYKNESEWETATRFYPWLYREGGVWKSEELDLHTFGARLMPKFGDTLDASIELAYQTGERGSQDVSGYMVDANAHWRPKVEGGVKPALGVGWYYLSGDDPGSDDDEGWNPLWARWPQYSELYTYAWDQDGAVRWSNFNMPYLDFEVTPSSAYRAKVLLGYMMAPEEDGSGGGDERGLLFTWWNYFTIGEKLLTGKDKLSGHLLLEVVDPGDYYASDQETAIFARWEFLYTF
jgi:hypothetical protein